MKFKLQPKHSLLLLAVLLIFNKLIFWDQPQRGLYRAYNEAQTQTTGVPLKDYIDLDWDKFCVVTEINDRNPIYDYPLLDGVKLPDLTDDGAWAIAFIKDEKVFRVTKAKDVYQDNTQKCFQTGAKMKIVPVPADTIPRPHIIFEN